MKENNVENLNDSISDILDTADKKVLERGLNYYKNGNIKALTLLPNGNFEAKVKGSDKTYKVNINLDKSNRVSGIICTCPYNYSRVCKHSVAVLMAIHNGEFRKADSNSKAVVSERGSEANKFVELLSGTDPKSLCHIIANYAERDEFFKYYVMSAVKLLPEEDAFISISKKIADVEEEYQKSEYRMKKRSKNRYIDTVSKIIDNISDYFANGYTLLTFKSAMVVLCSVIVADLVEYHDYFYKLMDSTTTLVVQSIDKIGENGNASEIEEMCNYAFEALKECRNEKICENIFAMLVPIGICIIPSRFNTAISELYRNMRISLEFAEDYFFENGSDEDYVQFLSSNSENGNVCEHFIDYCMERGKLEMAEKLCLECAEKWRYSEYQIVFLSKLYDVYTELQNTPKAEETAKRLVINGATEYYGILKNMLVSSGEWESKREELMNELSDKMQSDLFEKFLFDGEEYRTLLDYIETKDGEAIFTYGILLSEQFFDEVSMVYRAMIEEIAKTAGDRGKYRFICKKMCEMIKFSDPSIVRAMLSDFRERYKRRGVFMKELDSVETKLKKEEG